MKHMWSILFFLLFANHASAGTYQEVCYDEPKICAKFVDLNGFLAQIIIKKNIYETIDAELRTEFWQAGVIFQAVTDERYNSLTAPTIYRENAVADADLIDGMTDEEFDFKMNSLSCLGAAVGCAGGIAGSVSTGGFTLFFAGLSCGLAPVSCLQARRSYIKWRRVQGTMIQESKAKEAADVISNDSSSGGMGGEGEASSVASPGGFEKPTIDSGWPKGSGVISGHEFSGGGSSGKPIWLN